MFKGKSSIFTARAGTCSTSLLFENVFVTVQLRFELLMRDCRVVSRTIKFMSNSKCRLGICPLFKAKPQNEERKRLTL